MASKVPKKTVAARKPVRPANTPVIDDVRNLVELMVENDLGEVSVSDGDRSIVLKRGSSGQPAGTLAGAALQAAPVAPAADKEEEPAEVLAEVKSPMVGTLYLSPSPDSELYAAAGSYVDENTVVCIVEAMKVMNEVRAEVSGIITEICVKNTQPVEYGQVLLRVRPT
jgi:acetyl-CoA carboxylase biotin carboxyl carrier protein